MAKIKSCYPSKEASVKRQPKCQHHYWSGGCGLCRLTGNFVNPETCGKSYEWEQETAPEK